MLTDFSTPQFYTPSYSDREYWDAAAERLDTVELFAAANAIEGTPPPVLTPELFAQYRIDGNRSNYERPFSERTFRLGVLLYAEGFTGNGRRLPFIEREIEAILDEYSWSVPAHVPEGASERVAYTRVDLAAAARAWSLATADYLLGDKLSPQIRRRIRDEVGKRVLEPTLERIRSGNNDGFSWMVSQSNWNAVCHAGVLGATLLLSDSIEERAQMIASYEMLTQRYIDDFGSDAFCEEGIGYWSYGYGHYTVGAELIRLNTNGKMDLLAGEQQQQIAQFDVRWQMADGIYPPFGDASIRSSTPTTLHDFATLRYNGTGGLVGRLPSGTMVHRHPLGAQVYMMPFSLSLPRPQQGSAEERAIQNAATRPPLRDFFPESGALVVRSPVSGSGFAAAFKGGHNGQSHNHNDLGSFILVSNNQVALSDLGMDDYVLDTFGPKRYTSGMMNSFGHPVPLVGGQLQTTGRNAVAHTVRSEFSNDRDIWEIDMTSAYAVQGLERLTRTFIFERNDSGGSLQIIDRIRFSDETAATEFGTALVLSPTQSWHSNVRSPVPDGRRGIRIGQGRNAIDVRWDAVATLQSGQPEQNAEIEVKEDPVYGIIPDRQPRGKRLGFNFEKPVKEATIKMTFTPAG